MLPFLRASLPAGNDGDGVTIGVPQDRAYNSRTVAATGCVDGIQDTSSDIVRHYSVGRDTWSDDCNTRPFLFKTLCSLYTTLSR